MTGGAEPGVNLPFEQYEFDPRYYVQTAKNNISSFGHVIAEAASNSDEAISKRAAARGESDQGRILIKFDPESRLLIVVDDGIGLSAQDMRSRLRRVGVTAAPGSRRAFFHRGIREAFIAMGVSVVESISIGNGGAVYTRAVFDPTRGMAIEIGDAPLTDALRVETGIQNSGTKVTIPIRRLADLKPHQFTFPKLMEQIENCVQIRPVLLDPHRVVLFEFGSAAPRRVRFQYPRGESLIDERPVEIGGFKGTLWAGVAKEPIAGSGWSRQTRRYGILIRGQRAAYEVSLGTKLQSAPVHKQLFGELRIDGIEEAQREADAKADDEAQLIYKADRSGLNPDHPLVELIYQYLDSHLGPLLGALEANQRKKRVSEDVRRQLSQLARLINDAVKLEEFGEIESKAGRSSQDPQPNGQGWE